jgi:hypothetical protein
VRQDLYELGNLAVQAFVNVCKAEQKGDSTGETQNLVLQPQLIIRESSFVENPERSKHSNNAF